MCYNIKKEEIIKLYNLVCMNDDGEPPHVVINLTVHTTDENLEQLRMIVRRYTQSKHEFDNHNVKNDEKEIYDCMSKFDNVELTVIDTK